MSLVAALRLRTHRQGMAYASCRVCGKPSAPHPVSRSPLDGAAPTTAVVSRVKPLDHPSPGPFGHREFVYRSTTLQTHGFPLTPGTALPRALWVPPRKGLLGVNLACLVGCPRGRHRISFIGYRPPSILPRALRDFHWISVNRTVGRKSPRGGCFLDSVLLLSGLLTALVRQTEVFDIE